MRRCGLCGTPRGARVARGARVRYNSSDDSYGPRLAGRNRRPPACRGPYEGDMVFRAIYDKIKAGLSRTRDVFAGVASLFRLRGRVDRDFLAELEKRLYL